MFDGRTFELIQQKGDRKVITKGNNRPSTWEEFYKNVAANLMGKAELVITPEWSRRPIHILDLAVRSAAQGRAIKAKYR